MSAGFEQLDFDEFHRHELPRRLAAGHAALAAAGLRGRGPLAFRLPDGAAWTYAPRTGGVDVRPGDEGAETVIELERDAWEGIVHELDSAPGLIYGGRLKCRRGSAMNLVLWEPALRAIYNGRPVFDPYADPGLQDRHGAPLDTGRAFAQDDEREDMAHFLRTAGYLFVRGVFSADEAAGFLEEARELRGDAVKGDRLSWWGKNAAGEEILCRVTRAAAKPRLATLPGDPRLLELAALADAELVHRGGGDEGVSIIYKNPDMTEGLSDIPWHRDCGMGGHAVMCPVLIASVFLTPASAATGELRMLPGSQNGSCAYMDPREPNAPKGIGFEAQPGDVSLHYGDVMHAAPPPKSGLDGYRRSAVTGYARPGARHHRGEKNYNEVLHGREDGQVEHLSRVAERT